MLQTWRRTLFQRRPPTLQEPALCRPLAATQVRNLKPFCRPLVATAASHGSASGRPTVPARTEVAATCSLRRNLRPFCRPLVATTASARTQVAATCSILTKMTSHPKWAATKSFRGKQLCRGHCRPLAATTILRFRALVA